MRKCVAAVFGWSSDAMVPRARVMAARCTTVEESRGVYETGERERWSNLQEQAEKDLQKNYEEDAKLGERVEKGCQQIDERDKQGSGVA